MRQRTVIFVILAAVFGLGTFYFARSWVSKERVDTAQPVAAVEKPSVSILVATRDLPTGSFIRPEDLRWQVWPEGQVADQYLLKDKDTAEALSGAVVRTRIVAGEPVTNNRVIKPGDRGFLAAVLTPGMRAVAVPVTAVSGVAELIFPGDHVDIILSHQVKIVMADAKEVGAFASETVLTDVRILAIDQSTADIEGKPVLAKTVTFEVTPKQVEVIQVASSIGNLYLSLRSLAGTNSGGEEVAAGDDGATQQGVRSVSYTWDSDVSPLIHHEASDQGPTVTIMRGVSGKGSAGNTTSVSVKDMTINLPQDTPPSRPASKP